MMNKILMLISVLLPVMSVYAQEEQNSSTVATPPAAEQPPATAPAGEKKMVREANINLQTTVTGNQEQPRVMYILPWQSPLSPDLEMEMLSSQEDAVFGHVEREELTRELEAADEMQ
ncbi:MAG: hypothetical protein AAGC78_20030 [Cellvibrio sp.]|uniref:hypothetical protein n=1 Tax=Cellvibrio sp. TaxID=1965322 RepID=UPI0031A5DE5C